MKLYTYPRAPNPRRVHLFLAEKGLEIPLEIVDIMTRANRRPEFLDTLETREFIAGDAFSIADILALTTIDFASTLVELPLDPTLTQLAAWHQRMSGRPSVQAASF